MHVFTITEGGKNSDYITKKLWLFSKFYILNVNKIFAVEY